MAWYDKMRNAGIVGMCVGGLTFFGAGYYVINTPLKPVGRDAARVYQINGMFDGNELTLASGRVRDLLNLGLREKVMEGVIENLERIKDEKYRLLSLPGVSQELSEFNARKQKAEKVSVYGFWALPLILVSAIPYGIGRSGKKASDVKGVK